MSTENGSTPGSPVKTGLPPVKYKKAPANDKKKKTINSIDDIRKAYKSLKGEC